MRLLQIALIGLIGSSFVAHYSDSVAASKVDKSSKNSSQRSHKSNDHSNGKKHATKTNSGDVWERIRLGLRIPRPAPESAGSDQILTSSIRSTPTSSSESVKTTGTTHANNDELARLTTVIALKRLLRGESQLPEKLRLRQELIPHKGGGQNKIDLSPADKYTQLGRSKLGPKGSSASLTRRLLNKSHITPDEKLAWAKGDSLFNSSAVQRIRTRLGLHPELFKGGGVALGDTVGEDSAPDKKTGSANKTKNQQNAAITNCSILNKQGFARQGMLSENYSQMAEQCRLKQHAKYERVSRQIAGYSQRKGLLYQTSERARPYLYHIVDTLNKYNLPLDLALLPIVESAYQPTALSPKSAAGIWQFIPSTGREYGLEQNGDYDARLDITASTHAAIRFLSGLNDHFKGDWLLALAAYNCGQGAVDAAISRNQAEGLDTDFWSLDLPAETQDYVPRLLALSSIFANPGSYGLNLRPVKNEPYFIKVNIDRETDINHLVKKDLKTIAKLANFNTEEFGLLNSAYLKSKLSGRKPFSLLMPISNANQLHQSLAFMAQPYKDENAALPFFSESSLFSGYSWSKTQESLLAINLSEDQQWTSPAAQLAALSVKSTSTVGDTTKAKTTVEDYWAVHYLDKGESLKVVAEHHGISEQELREANKFKRRQTLSLGQRLLIPLKPIAAPSIKRTTASVLYKDITGNFDPPLSRL
jgi:soluble lytic murein transglycosylase-like protein